MMQTGILDLITHSGLVVKIVLIILCFASILCWTIIFNKFFEFKFIAKQNFNFLEIFWGAKNLEEVFSKIEKSPNAPLVNIFKSAYKELKKLTTTDRSNETYTEEVENVQRSLTRATHSEISFLEKNMTWLATTASAAPFVGLFGTVWGIMNSFQSIGSTGSANLAVVAPGISEALIATAVGLAAAIPAVVAYNHFVNQIKKFSTDMDCFSQDLLNIIQRSLMNMKKNR